jgi:hypothetical protein
MSDDYCKLTHFPRCVPFEMDGVILVADRTYFFEGSFHPTYSLVPEVWAGSLALERVRIDQMNQDLLDREWQLIDAASAGDSDAAALIKFKTRFAGYRYPESRVIKPSTLGLMVPNPIDQTIIAMDCGGDFHRTSRCDVCQVKVVTRDRRHRYCSPACEAKAKAERIKASNDARIKVTHAPMSCRHCGAMFTPARSDARFCSSACRLQAHRKRS